MPLVSRILRGVRDLIWKERAERDLDAELGAFFDDAVDHNMQAGMSRLEARRAAHVELGSRESVKDRVREIGWESLVESSWRDACYASRSCFVRAWS